MRPGRAHARRALLTLAVVLAISALAAACSGGDDAASSDETPTSEVVAAPKGHLPYVLCKDEAAEDLSVPSGVDVLTTNLVRQASLADAPPHEEFVVRCDNTGVTTLEAPTDYRAVDPGPLARPQTALRVATDFSAPVEAAPIINFFAASVGGAQFPTQPRFGTLIQQSAEGSLSSGTRDPREGTSIAEDCRALPVRDVATGEFTGKAQFFVNCGGDERAWVLVAAAPDNGDPYFVQMVAQARDTADADAIGRALATLSVDSDRLAAFAEAEAPPPTAPSSTEAAPTTTAAP